ncbi:MAG: hypothetical protein ACPL4E_00865 [Thermoproteota archaeon]
MKIVTRFLLSRFGGGVVTREEIKRNSMRKGKSYINEKGSKTQGLLRFIYALETRLQDGGFN